MGASSKAYLAHASHAGGRQRIASEVWAINAMGGVIQHDLLFHMDDVKIQESRAEIDSKGNISGMLHWLKDHPKFMTSRRDPNYPGSIEYPLQDVINKVGVQYFNNTVAYAVAFAIYKDFKKISLWGVDFSYADGHKAEKGRGCVEYLLGIASARGVHIEVPADSTLLDANIPDDQRFYGYDVIMPIIKNDENGVKVLFKDRDKIPTAEEIEKRYNHICRQ